MTQILDFKTSLKNVQARTHNRVPNRLKVDLSGQSFGSEMRIRINSRSRFHRDPGKFLVHQGNEARLEVLLSMSILERLSKILFDVPPFPIIVYHFA